MTAPDPSEEDGPEPVPETPVPGWESWALETKTVTGLEGYLGDFEAIGPTMASKIRRRGLRNKLVVAPLVALLIISIVATIAMFV